MRMFAASVPEKVITEFTGHKNTKALHQYEYTSVNQTKTARLAISGNASHDRKPLAVVENTKVDTEGKKPDLGTLQQGLPTTSGNCTINIKL